MQSSAETGREAIPRVAYAGACSALPMDDMYRLLRFSESLHALGQAQGTSSDKLAA